MNIQLILEIIQIAAGVAVHNTSGPAQQDLTIAQDLTTIIQKATLAYQQHTGQPLDPSLIQPEAPIS